MSEPGANRHPLGELALLFLRLGLTAFGGPAAHIAMMRQEVVEERKWLTPEEFLDLLGATSFIPGPSSTEMAIHVGHRRAGFRGLLTAGVCFITPAVIVTLGLAWLYARYGQLPRAAAVLYGIKPVIVAIVIQALWALGKTAVKGKALAVLGLVAAASNALGANELLVLFAAGLVHALLPGGNAQRPVESAERRSDDEPPTGSTAALLAALPAAGAVGAGISSSAIFLVFLKIGSVLFGSGYVLLAFLRADLVEARHWLTEAQLLDAVAAGQVTPGPVFTTATFIGYLLHGLPGAGAATLGIFVPAFVFVAASGPLVPRLRRSRWASRALDGVNVASLALMAVVTFQLGRAALLDAWTVALAGVSAIVLLRFKSSSVWLMAAGAIAGVLLHALR